MRIKEITGANGTRVIFDPVRQEIGSCSHMRDLLQSKVAVVRSKIAELKALELRIARVEVDYARRYNFALIPVRLAH
jgi:hypothetical protein